MAELSERPAAPRRLMFGSRAEQQPRSWLVIFDYAFYALVGIGVAAFIYYFFSHNRLFVLYLPFFVSATGVTLALSVTSMVLASILGLIGALGRLSRFAVIRWIATSYVEIVRGTPLLVQLLLWFYGVGTLLHGIGFDPYVTAFQFMTVLQNNSLVPHEFNSYFYGVLGLSFNYGAYLTEVFRSGILGVDRGQTEAGLSLGLNSRQIMQRIVLPQALRITVPPFTNNFITLIQDSALLSVISVFELEHQTFRLALPQLDANDKMFVFAFGAVFYLLLCYPLSLLARFLEARMAKAYQH